MARLAPTLPEAAELLATWRVALQPVPTPRPRRVSFREDPIIHAVPARGDELAFSEEPAALTPAVVGAEDNSGVNDADDAGNDDANNEDGHVIDDHQLATNEEPHGTAAGSLNSDGAHDPSARVRPSLAPRPALAPRPPAAVNPSSADTTSPRPPVAPRPELSPRPRAPSDVDV